jgi:hypothetical protein
MIKGEDIQHGSLVQLTVNKRFDRLLSSGGLDIIGMVLEKRNKSSVALVYWYNNPCIDIPYWIAYSNLIVLER